MILIAGSNVPELIDELKKVIKQYDEDHERITSNSDEYVVVLPNGARNKNLVVLYSDFVEEHLSGDRDD